MVPVSFRHMVDAEQLERSRRIIEIGALTAREPVRKDETMLEKLREVERHLKDRYLKDRYSGYEDALEGCASIRGALTGAVAVDNGR